MSILLDGTGGVTTPGVVNTAGETIATTLSVTGATNLAVSSGNVGIGTASPSAKLNVVTSGGNSRISIGDTAVATYSTVLMYGGNGKYNFQLGAQANINNGFEITPSTATGGTTFSTPAFIVDSAGLLKFNSGYGSAATAYGCRAWVNFNGTGTVAIRASGNVSSITDNGTGSYTINFTTAMPDVNYSLAVATLSNRTFAYNGGTYTVAALQLDNRDLAGIATDASNLNVAIFR